MEIDDPTPSSSSHHTLDDDVKAAHSTLGEDYGRWGGAGGKAGRDQGSIREEELISDDGRGKSIRELTEEKGAPSRAKSLDCVCALIGISRVRGASSMRVVDFTRFHFFRALISLGFLQEYPNLSRFKTVSFSSLQSFCWCEKMTSSLTLYINGFCNWTRVSLTFIIIIHAIF